MCLGLRRRRLRTDLGGGLPVFVVYRLEERLAARAATPFLDLQLQRKLREAMEGEEAELRTARGLGELVRSTYVQPAEIREALLSGGRRPPSGGR